MKKFLQVLALFVVFWLVCGAVEFVGHAVPFSILFPVGMGAIMAVLMANAAR